MLPPHRVAQLTCSAEVILFTEHQCCENIALLSGVALRESSLPSGGVRGSCVVHARVVHVRVLCVYMDGCVYPDARQLGMPSPPPAPRP